MIFGILGKFGIGIGNPKIFRRKNFHRKKNPKTFGRKILVEIFGWSKIFLIGLFFIEIFDENFFNQNIFDRFFWSKKKSSKISMKKCSIKKIRSRKKSITKIFDQTFSDFFRRKKIAHNFLGYLFRSKNSPGFQKSYLE